MRHIAFCVGSLEKNIPYLILFGLFGFIHHNIFLFVCTYSGFTHLLEHIDCCHVDQEMEWRV